MARNELTVITIETSPELTLEEVCAAYQITPEWLDELISYGAIEPHHARFDARNLGRIRRLVRLQHDLELNLAGAALALDLLDRIDNLQTQVELFRKHITSSR
jgi:chaperone modulatory protein CbpM